MTHFDNFHDYLGGHGFDYGFPFSILPLVLLATLWVVFWKAMALWTAAKRKEKVWFVAIVVIHTFGILEIIYLFAIAKIKFSELLKSFD